jgi:hypothetical protein
MLPWKWNVETVIIKGYLSFFDFLGKRDCSHMPLFHFAWDPKMLTSHLYEAFLLD